MMYHRRRSAFTLIELLVVIAIIAILAIVVVLTLNPAQMLAQSRDANRVSDLQTLSSAISLYQADQSGSPSFSMGSSSVVYASTPDPAASSTCGASGMLTLPSGYAWHCASPSNYKNASSSGWLPINFNQISSGAPFGSLPADPTNSTSSRLFYTYTTNGSQFELTAPMESQKYQLGGSGDVIGGDGAPLATVYAKGTNLTLKPLDYGDPTLVGYWPLNEGTGVVAYDESGNNATGTWYGTPAGTSGYYSPGLNGGWAGYFNGSSNQYIAINTFQQVNANNFTVTGWVNHATSTSGVIVYRSGWCSSGVTKGFQVGQDTGGHEEFWYGTGSGDSWVGTSTPFPVGVWSAAAFALNGTSLSMYENGVLVGTFSLSAPLMDNTSTLDLGTGCGPGNWSGNMENIRIYDRALTAAQVQALYNGGK